MPHYRAYLLAQYRRVISVQCADEQEARERAEQFVDNNDVELWQLDCRIALFEAIITRTLKEAGHERPQRAQDVTELGKKENGLLAVLGQVLGGRAPVPAANAAEPPDAPKASEVVRFKPPDRTTSTAQKRGTSPEHLQNLILAAFRQIEGFPKNGVSITVYGLHPWNAMITFAPGSSSFKNATMYREMLPQIVAKLREDFYVSCG
ncbi:hypothetical protein [Bradyrhizobium sp. ARR65]|uniref:hypothetical protein n=1 Tax=Bradyrhizobium sp. ARR65 TaxID=1040989 RepID=UPI0004662B14|nr:hypothetical protein [Bradyrhizobium sp. ARR65]